MEAEKDLELDLEIIEQQGETTSSMGDIYGYAVFSEEFQGKIDEYQQQQERTHEGCLERVLNGSADTQLEASFARVLQAETTAVIKKDLTAVPKPADQPLFIGGFVILGGLLTAVVFYLIERKRKQGGEKRGYKNHHSGPGDRSAAGY